MLSLLKNLEKFTNFITPSSAYVHIPFCRRRCYYCDFPISVVGDQATGTTSGMIKQYVEVLCQEIEITPLLGHSLETIFFGGGTPSLLTVKQLEHILEQLDQHFGIAADAEISIEMDPGTFSREQLKGYRDAGVNRVSLGVQAFQDELLRVCGRSHNLNDIFAAVDLLRQVEFPDFSLDLISGLPHQTLEQWQASLEAAIKIAPTHISSYDLIIESVTAFGRQYNPGGSNPYQRMRLAPKCTVLRNKFLPVLVMSITKFPTMPYLVINAVIIEFIGKTAPFTVLVWGQLAISKVVGLLGPVLGKSTIFGSKT